MAMKDNRFNELLNLVLSGKASDLEKEELAELCQQDGEKRLLYKLFVKGGVVAGRSEAEAAYGRHRQKMLSEGYLSGSLSEIGGPGALPGTDRRRRSRLYAYTGIFAMLLLLLCAFLYVKQGPVTVEYVEIVTKKKERKHVVLPDSSDLWLNEESKLVYSKPFGAKLREVSLVGEAYFDVAKNKEKPFVVHIGEAKVRVLGTSFNLRAYPDEEQMETALVEGSVEVELKDRYDKTVQVLLEPGQKLTIPNVINKPDRPEKQDHAKKIRPFEQDVQLRTLGKSPEDSLALDGLWRENKLAFDADPLYKVVNKLEKWYDVKIVIRNDKLAKKSFSGIFERKSIYQVLDALKATGQLDYAVEAGTLVVY